MSKRELYAMDFVDMCPNCEPGPRLRGVPWTKLCELHRARSRALVSVQGDPEKAVKELVEAARGAHKAMLGAETEWSEEDLNRMANLSFALAKFPKE